MTRLIEERTTSMFRAAASQVTTSRWDLSEELPILSAHGFEALSVWRHKFSDIGLDSTRRLLDRAGIRASSVQWAGGFTGGDGRTFDESVADAQEAIDLAGGLGAPVLVLHSGCRGGHTRSHAQRLLVQALEILSPQATEAGVSLAIKPLHPSVAAGCGFLTRLDEALGIVDDLIDRDPVHACIGLTIDLWHFGDDPDLGSLLPLLADRTSLVQVADRNGPPTSEQERLPVGRGILPLQETVEAFLDQGYRGDFEFDPVGAAVEAEGYERVLADLRSTADAWSRSLRADGGHEDWPADGPRRLAHPPRPAAGNRRSQASSQTASPG
ncbi:MAG: sugar phosphate isomerase/epimerase family protein [Planctomycetia bacterium]